MRVGWNADRDVEAVVIPRWLGVADHDFARRRVLMLPLPFNFLYAFGLWAFLHVKFPRFQDEIERRVANERETIRHTAYQEGYSQGVKDGYERHKRMIGEFIDASLADARRKT